MVLSGLRGVLAHPLTRGLALDAPQTTALRRQIIREKPFLRQIYQQWYRAIAAAVPAGDGAVLELGSGAGFLREVLPEVIPSEVMPCPGVSVILDAQHLPFADATLRAIVMTDVLHHLPNVRFFFSEATRCVRANGVVVMIEPWFTAWSGLVYRKLHHEPFEPDVPNWEFASGGPLSGANGALPWIVFARDRERFEREFDGLRIRRIEPSLPFRYLLTGGVSMRSLLPGQVFGILGGLERALQPWADKLGMFACIVLERTTVGQRSPERDHGSQDFHAIR
jgi:SAM-dependent methyltransferase